MKPPDDSLPSPAASPPRPAAGGARRPPGRASLPVPTYSVTATVFYDQNGNGQLDGSEAVRVPGVEVVIGTGTGTSAPGTGQAVVTGIREGAQTVAVRTESVPAYFQPAPPVPIQVPGATEVRIPLTLPIGDNNPNVYLGLGDSITYGDGSSDRLGYVLKLQNLLGPHFGRAEVHAIGRQGDSSAETAEVTRKTLGWFDPAYTLILLGTNDWQDQTCQKQGPSACFTIDSLRSIVEDVKDWDSLPVLATIIPGNPAKVPAGRNAWYDEMNVTHQGPRAGAEGHARRPQRRLQGRREPARPLLRRRAPERRRLPGDGPGLVQGHHPRPLGRGVLLAPLRLLLPALAGRPGEGGRSRPFEIPRAPARRGALG